MQTTVEKFNCVIEVHERQRRQTNFDDIRRTQRSVRLHVQAHGNDNQVNQEKISLQEAQLSQRDRATLLVTGYFAKSLKVTHSHSKRHCLVARV